MIVYQTLYCIFKSNLRVTDVQKSGIFDLFVPKSLWYIDLYFEIFGKTTSNLQYKVIKSGIFNICVPTEKQLSIDLYYGKFFFPKIQHKV